jgi:hypothetical protein
LKAGLKRKGTAVPYGGVYRWVDPISKVEVLGTHWEMLMNRIYEERRANSLPCGIEFEAEVEADLCRDYPAECELNDPRFPKKRGWIPFHEIVAGTKLLLRFKLAGSPLVAQEEAERRANICATCPFNVEYHRPCAGLCGELKSLVESIVGAARVSQESRLKSCSLCGCFLGAAVWLPVDLQRSVLSETQTGQFDNVEWCWKGSPKISVAAMR